MKLILESSNRGRRNSFKGDVRIGKTSISFERSEMSKLGVDNSWYGAFGYDADMELSLFLRHEIEDGLFKIITSEKTRVMSIPITLKNRKTMSQFIGGYNISNKYNKDGYLILNLKKTKQ